MTIGEAYYIVEMHFAELYLKLPSLSLISNGLLWVTAIFTVISGVIYLKDSRKIIDFTK
jgi:phosphatidylglycerophosphate synthase